MSLTEVKSHPRAVELAGASAMIYVCIYLAPRAYILPTTYTTLSPFPADAYWTLTTLCFKESTLAAEGEK